MAEAGVPTAEAFVCTTPEEAERALDAFGPPYVVKDDALAAGKGVVVTADRDAALAHANACSRVVIEEFLDGPEVSLFAVTDGTTVVPLQPAQDFKRVGDDDTGPNTGGMGAYSPVPMAGPDVVDAVVERAVEPLLAALRRRGIDYRGALYAGLMLTAEGPKVLEFNVRFGDPEAQVVLPRLAGDVAGLLAEAADGRLRSTVTFTADACVTVVLAAAGYPSTPRRGDMISGMEQSSAVDGVVLFHAGTAKDETGRLVTAGGRVLDVTATGSTLTQARERAYEAASLVRWPGVHYRHDIAAAAAAAAGPGGRTEGNAGPGGRPEGRPVPEPRP
jgi:phosphoribosylamine--glycine ligase